jgi:hypothetical protein
VVCSRSRSQWESLVEELVGSDLPLEQFARARGVSEASLRRWWARVHDDLPVSEEPVPFLPVVVEGHSDTVELGTTGAIEAALPNGVVLRFERGLDLQGLMELAQAFGCPRSS